MKVTYTGERSVRANKLDFKPNETKEVANDLVFPSDFTVEKSETKSKTTKSKTKKASEKSEE